MLKQFWMAKGTMFTLLTLADVKWSGKSVLFWHRFVASIQIGGDIVW